MIIQALRIGLIEHEASDTGGVPRWKSSCPDRLAEATVHRMVMENRPVDPGSIQGSHRPISFIRIKQNTRER